MERSSSTSWRTAAAGSSARKNCGMPSIFKVPSPNGSIRTPFSEVPPRVREASRNPLVERANDRNQEPLTRHTCVLQLGAEPLKEYSLVRSMLIHQNKPFLVFHQYVEAAEHAQNAKTLALRLGDARFDWTSQFTVRGNRPRRGGLLRARSD